MKRMNWKPLALFLTVAALCTGAVAQEKTTPLGDAIEKIGDSFKTISAACGPPASRTSPGLRATWRAIIKENALKANTLVPQLIEEYRGSRRRQCSRPTRRRWGSSLPQ